MRLASWFLLLFYSTVTCTIKVFPNICAGESKAGAAVLPQEIKIPSSFKVSAVFTDWTANYTMIIDEIRRDKSYSIEITTKNSSHKWMTLGGQLIHNNQTDCSVVNDSSLFTLPPDISTILSLNTSSIADIVNAIADKNITGFNSYVRIVSGVEGVGWIGCINSTNSSSGVAVEVVYAGKDHPSPLVLSVALSSYDNISDINSTIISRISLDFSPFREVSDLESHLEIPHGRVCSGLIQSAIPIDFPDEIEVMYSKQSPKQSIVSSKLIYYSSRNMSAESVIDGRALLFNESFSNEEYLIVHDGSRGVEYVFSSAPSCEIRDISPQIHTDSLNGFAPPTYLFLPQIDSLNFSLYSNVSQQDISVLEYRSRWGSKFIEAIVHGSKLSTISIFSEGNLESISHLTIMEKTSKYGVDMESLLRECFNPFSNNFVSFILKGVSVDDISKARENLVSTKIAESLVSISKATFTPYRLSFLYTKDDQSNENTRVIMRVADARKGSNETSSSQFMDIINATLPSGISIQVSDKAIWTTTTDSLMPYPPPPPISPPSFNGYTGGSMLVLGIFMIMLGVALGVGGVALVSRRQRLSTLAYQMSGGRVGRLASSARESAYRMIDETARINMHELKDNPGARTDGRLTRKATNQAGHTQGALERAAKPPLGWIWGDFFRPWHRMFPGERKFNTDYRIRRPLVPISLIEICRLVDLGWIDSTKLIDLPTLIGTRKMRLRDEVGIMLTSEGCSSLSIPLHLEVQATDQETIGAIEREGGSIRVAYYDAISLKCVNDPIGWMSSGEPIPARRIPPLSLYESFSDPSKRGYLAPKEEIEKERRKLAALMGYAYTDEKKIGDKSVTQVFEGIPPGSVVNLKNKTVMTSTNPEIRNLYAQEICPNPMQ